MCIDVANSLGRRVEQLADAREVTFEQTSRSAAGAVADRAFEADESSAGISRCYCDRDITARDEGTRGLTKDTGWNQRVRGDVTLFGKPFEIAKAGTETVGRVGRLRAVQATASARVSRSIRNFTTCCLQ